MNAMTPWSGMRRELERFFDRFPEPVFEVLDRSCEWAPKLDVSETKEAVLVKAELPGVEPNEISLSLQGDLLMLKGEKSQEKEEKDEQFHRVERSYGAFLRAVRLPTSVDASKVTAGFKNGVLTVTLPKAGAERPRRIAVQTH
jgi:HSP20 family protein